MTPADDYRAIREGAALGALSPRRQIAVAGSDRATYLQGLLTNDIQQLAPGSGCYAAWLTPQDRMLTDLDVLESGDLMLLDLPADQAEPTLQRLDQYLFSEDVQLESLDGRLTGIWIHGPKAPAAIEQAVTGVPGTAGWPDHAVRRGGFDGSPVMVARMDRLGVPGYCIYVEPSVADAVAEALARAGALRAGAAALEAARIEAGFALFGVDMTEDTIPLEAGIESTAISFSKGCYVGQEVIVRVLHRGGGRVAKKLVCLRLGGPGAARGDTLHAGEREIGVVTSAASSPELGPIAMGYVHRDFVEPGTAVRVRAAGGEIAAAVAPRPMR
jgi:folate-binding protein YgfZ